MAKPKDRLTVVETVYHRPFGQDPTAVETGFTRELKTAEQVYTRRLTATEDWQSLDCGWLESCSSLSIENLAGKNLQVVPSEEERAEIAKQVIEICPLGWDGFPWLVYPGESMRACPSMVTALRIRCLSGKAKFIVSLVPE